MLFVFSMSYNDGISPFELVGIVLFLFLLWMAYYDYEQIKKQRLAKKKALKEKLKKNNDKLS